jgi:hypothetical protein
MQDGGLTCDPAAYLIEGECPSSMVGTIAPFEAMLLGKESAEKNALLDRAAAFLIERRLMLGSTTAHNAEEREAQRGWLLPCFPRFYFYDVLRGIAALARWAELRKRAIPLGAIEFVVDHLATSFPDGVVRLGREAFAVHPSTWAKTPGGAWERRSTSRFPLLDALSVVGDACATSTRAWSETRRRLIDLADAGQIIDH